MPRKYHRSSPTNVRTKPRKTLEASFWERVYIPEDLMECWLWLGGTNGHYGNLGIREPVPYGKTHTYSAHRVSYEIFYGPIAPEMDICHDCPTGDNPLCVNPRHLFMASTQDNLADMRRKGRARDMQAVQDATRQASLEKIAAIKAERLAAQQAAMPPVPEGPYQRPIKPLEERFWAKVNRSRKPNGCWLWTGYLTTRGYGEINIGRRGEGTILAHRLSYILHYGAILPSFEVMHNCPTGDNPACVNPKHLRLGTHAHNMRDAREKGRLPYGERKSKYRLTDAIIIEIRFLYTEKHLRLVDLAKRYNLRPQHIYNIVNYRTWKHI